MVRKEIMKASREKTDWFFLFLLIFILGVGFFLRLIWLEKYPIGFRSEEALLGYRGKLLAMTFTDETGRKLPLIFSSFQGYQLPFSSYLVATSVKLFGLSKWAVRFPFAFAGCLGLLSFPGILWQLFPKNKWLVFWSVLIMAISPGVVFLSRSTSGIFLLFNVFLCFFCFSLLLIKRRNFTIPLVLLFGFCLVFLSIVISYLRLPGAKEDFLKNNFGFFANSAIPNSINQMRGEDIHSGNPVLGKIFYNKIFYGIKFLEKVGQHLKPQFYFAAGEGNSLHGLSNFGPLLVTFLPLFLIGIWHLLNTKELSKYKNLLLIWFFLGILPSVFDRSGLNQEKLVLVLPAMVILIGFSASRLARPHLFLFVPLLFFNFFFVLYDAVWKEPIRAQGAWQFGVEELAGKLKVSMGNYDKIFISDRFSPDIGSQLLFFFDYPGEKLWRETNLRQGEISPHEWVNQIGKIKMGDMSNWRVNPGEKGLFIISSPEEEKLIGNYRILAANQIPLSEVCYKVTEKILGLNKEPTYLIAQGMSSNCILK
jgi:hypothetical protein